MNWQTGIPKLNQTSEKSKLLWCIVRWGNDEFRSVAWYNSNTGEWIERNSKPVIGEVIKWADED